MSQNPLHYAREECLPWLIELMDKAGREYAEDRIKTTFAANPWIEREIGAEVRAAWRERFGQKENA